jgi:TniQ
MPQNRILQPLFGLPRTFPVRLTVANYESLHSYVHRLSALHDVPLGQTLSRLGLVTEVRPKSIVGFGVAMPEEQVRTFSFVAGISESQTRSLLLSRFSGISLSMDVAKLAMPDGIRKASTSEWAYFSGSHFCPDCLRESGGAWNLSWKLPWSFACVKHQALLHDHCPDCGQRPASGHRDGSLSPAFIGKVPRPGFCSNVLPPGLAGRGKGSTACGCNLMEIESHKGPTLKELLDSQKMIDEYLTSQKLIDTGKSLTFFREMRSVCALILYRAELEDFPRFPDHIQEAIALHIAHRNGAQDERSEGGAGRNGARPRMYMVAPKSAALMTAVAFVALRIVQQTDLSALRESLRVLGDRTCDRSSKYRYAVLNYFDLSDRLHSAFTEAISERGTFDRRAGHRSNVKNRVEGKNADGEGPQYEPRHVPQCMPQTVFDAQFKTFFPKVQDRFSRRFCSLAAAKSLGYTWRESALLLELPSSMYGMANRCVMLLKQQGDYDRFAEALYKWTKDIATAKVRFDYARRREAPTNNGRKFVPIPVFLKGKAAVAASTQRPGCGRKSPQAIGRLHQLWSHTTSAHISTMSTGLS